MKFEASKPALLDAVATAERASGKNLPLAVLNDVVVSAQEGKIFVRATNLDLAIEIQVPGKILREGDVAVPGAIFRDTIAASREDSVIKVESDDRFLSVTMRGGSARIAARPTDDFPNFPNLEKAPMVSIPANDLVKGFRSVAFSSSVSTIRPELGTVAIFPGSGSLVFVATDSFRLAEKTIQLERPPKIDPFLVPIRNVTEIIRALEGLEGNVEFRYAEHHACISHGSLAIATRLVDGNFPDYKQIIPKDHQTTITALSGDVLHTLKTAGIFSDKLAHIRLSLKKGGDTLMVSAQTPERGEITASLPAKISGESIEISFNQKYLLDAFQSIHTDSITLKLHGPGRPVIVEGVGDMTFLYLVMPMNR